MGEVFQTRYLPLGGVNNSIGDEFIKDEECSDAANYQPDLTYGTGIIKREGLTQVSSVMTATISSVYQGRNENYFTSGTTTRAFAGTSLDSGLTAGYPSWTSFATYDIMVNGTNLRKTSDGANFSALANCPAGAKYVAAVNNFVYVAGHGYGKLRWADVGTAETWTVTNELVLTQDENDNITGLAPWRNALLVTCEKSFELISGYSTLEQGVSYYSKADGCNSHRSIVVTPVGVFWWSKRSGIVWVKEDMTADYPAIRKIPKTLASINWGQNAYVIGTFDPRQHKVMFYTVTGTGTTNNIRIDYYWDTDSFWLHTGAGTAMAACGMAVDTGVACVYTGGYATSTYLYKVSGATDDGTHITSYFDTKREAYGSPTAYKVTKNVTLHTNLSTSDAITYEAWIDNDTSADTAWSNTVDTGPQDTVIGVNRQHRKIKHRITDHAATTTRILGLTHDGTLMRRV